LRKLATTAVTMIVVIGVAASVGTYLVVHDRPVGGIAAGIGLLLAGIAFESRVPSWRCTACGARFSERDLQRLRDQRSRRND